MELDEGEPRQPTTDHLTDSGNDVSSDGPSSEDDAVDDSEPNQGPQARRGQSNRPHQDCAEGGGGVEGHWLMSANERWGA